MIQQVAMTSEVDQASIQLKEDEQELEDQMIGNNTTQILNLKQLKSFDILKSAISTIFASNTKFMLFMILSIIPFFAFMVFYEIKIQKSIDALPYFLANHSTNDDVIELLPDDDDLITGYIHQENPEDVRMEELKTINYLSDILQLCFFYLVLYPVLEIFSMIVTMKIASKSHASDQKQATLKQVLNINLKGVCITYLCVHLLSTLSLLALFWIVVNHRALTSEDYPLHFILLDNDNNTQLEMCVFILSTVIHAAFFIALLYKYLQWSIFWNLSMVISALGEETGIAALGMADYYGKHCKRTGFQLMLVFFAFGNVLRLLCLFAGSCTESVEGVLVAVIVIGLFCSGNLVKWVAFVLYFYDCKQQTLEKKADEEVGKPKNDGDVS